MQIGSRTLILNPASGTGEHADIVPRLARGRGFEVWETEAPGDGVALGRRAAEEGVGELAVCGGDGTVNEVLCGLAEAGHVEAVTLSVVPGGTANLLAGNVGVRDVEHGIEVADTGTVRSVDLGTADGLPFVVSCIAGLPADASTAASGELKQRLGTLAFVVTAIQEARSFDGLALSIDTEAGTVWEGEAICVLVGNARKFVEEGGQADMEDGRFDVAVVERTPASSLVAEAAVHRLLGEGTENVEHFRAAELSVTSADGEPIGFSRDGELSEFTAVELHNRAGVLDLRVGEGYDPTP